MSYHLYVIYLLLAILVTVVVIIFIFSKNTTREVIYTEFTDATVITEKFDDSILTGLTAEKGDKLMIAVEPTNDDAMSVKFKLSQGTETIGEVTATKDKQKVEIDITKSENDFKLEYSEATGNVILQSIVLEKTQYLY